MQKPIRRLLASLATVTLAVSIISLATAEVSLPAIFGDHMVLQQGQKNKVWGWADAGESIQVTIDNQSHKTVAADDGSWNVFLAPLSLGQPRTLTVSASNTIDFTDVLVGEVWICSGQSNMEWPVFKSTGSELEIASAHFPEIRLITVPRVGTQEPQNDFEGQWELCSPETIANFSAIGYAFGRRLHQTLGVPIGLIDNAWGGSAAEAWVPNEVLEADSQYKPLLDSWHETEETYDYETLLDAYEEKLNEWNQSDKKEAKPRKPNNRLTGNHRPANIYNGVLHPTIGYGIKGVIWYQGESNAGRAYQYRDLFPLMIQTWRDEWQQGDFPFYYVQLADYRKESPTPKESDWAELREAQTMTLDRLPNVGQAVIIDLGEGRDIHPRNKQPVANRLARWALANDYGKEMSYQSPTYKSMKVKNGKITIKLDYEGKGLRPFDTTTPIGFAIAGKDKKFVWAEAEIIDKNTIEVWSDEVENPKAVRYAWADNPVCNLFTEEGLPVTPFRTDDWPGITAGVNK